MVHVEAGSTLSPPISDPHPGVAQVRAEMLQQIGQLRHYAVALEQAVLANPDDDATISEAGVDTRNALVAVWLAVETYRHKRTVKGIA